MDEKLRNKVLFYAIMIFCLGISWISLIGIYGIAVPILLSIMVYYEFKKESDRIKGGFPKIDERSLKVSGQAAMITWRVTFLFLIAFGLYHASGIGPEIDTYTSLMTGAGLSLCTLFIANFYYDRKGD
ncbi:MAG: hypothetical protein KAS67_05160 [Thermoplasmata archaeon]|nr:hypothetical protein [Thermoplasmata archaeon]